MVDHRTLTIQNLPNEVLLHIFYCHRQLFGTNTRPPAVAWRWHTLTHVCHRWRHLIFGSLRHLGARFVIPRKSPKIPWDPWPALPISIWYDSENWMSFKQNAEVSVALKHHDRLHEICLPIGTRNSFLISNLGDKSFPELEHLTLSGIGRPITVPTSFLSGSTPLPRQLRSIRLNFLFLPILPQLLLSSHDLVSLHLGYYTLTHVGFISPAVLSTSLSATTQLEYLYIDCIGDYIESRPELTSVNSSPHDLVVLLALTYFHFGGFIEYMENLVSRFHAPHLEKLDVYSDQSVSDIPQLSQFISRTERLSLSPFRTSISLNMGVFSIEHYFKPLPPPQEVLTVYFKCATGSWQASQVDHICTQLSSFASRVKQLKILAFHHPSNLERKTDPAPWLQLLTPYTSVAEVEFCGRGAPCTGIASALKQSMGETAQELLPALRILRIRGFHTWSINLITSFVTACQRTGRPVSIRRLTQTNKDSDWETLENDTCKVDSA